MLVRQQSEATKFKNLISKQKQKRTNTEKFDKPIIHKEQLIKKQHDGPKEVNKKQAEFVL